MRRLIWMLTPPAARRRRREKLLAEHHRVGAIRQDRRRYETPVPANPVDPVTGKHMVE